MIRRNFLAALGGTLGGLVGSRVEAESTPAKSYLSSHIKLTRIDEGSDGKLAERASGIVMVPSDFSFISTGSTPKYTLCCVIDNKISDEVIKLYTELSDKADITESNNGGVHTIIIVPTDSAIVVELQQTCGGKARMESQCMTVCVADSCKDKKIIFFASHVAPTVAVMSPAGAKGTYDES